MGQMNLSVNQRVVLATQLYEGKVLVCLDNHERISSVASLLYVCIQSSAKIVEVLEEEANCV